MNKKNYIKPEMEVEQISSSSILTGSDVVADPIFNPTGESETMDSNFRDDIFDLEF